MDKRSVAEKEEVLARVVAFPNCGFSSKISSNIWYYRSFVGRDFKTFLQMVSHCLYQKKK